MLPRGLRVLLIDFHFHCLLDNFRFTIIVRLSGVTVVVTGMPCAKSELRPEQNRLVHTRPSFIIIIHVDNDDTHSIFRDN